MSQDGPQTDPFPCCGRAPAGLLSAGPSVQAC